MLYRIIWSGLVAAGISANSGNLSIIRNTSVGREAGSTLSFPSEGTVAFASDSDIANWEKPDPVEEHIRACAAKGLGSHGRPAPDPQTDLRKNRVDTSASYHSVSFSQILALPWSGLPRRRTGWNESDSVKVTQYEGPPVALEGYLVAVVEEGAESTNCEIDTHRWHDWHMWLVPTLHEATSRDRSRAVVVEVTPRIRVRTPNWTLPTVKALARNHEKVRISGWLMWDPDHPDQVGNTRATTWEIHPATKIEVETPGEWQDLRNPQPTHSSSESAVKAFPLGDETHREFVAANDNQSENRSISHEIAANRAPMTHQTMR